MCQLMRESKALQQSAQRSQPKKKKPRLNNVTGKMTVPSTPTRTSISGAYAPTDDGIIDVNTVLSKEGCWPLP